MTVPDAGGNQDARQPPFLTSEPSQGAERAGGLQWLEEFGGGCLSVDGNRSLSASGRIREEIMDRQNASTGHFPSPSAIVVLGGLHAVSAVDEDHPEGCTDKPGCREAAGYSDHCTIFQTGGMQVVAQMGQAVDFPDRIVEQVRVMVALAGLVLFRAPVVIDADEKPTRGLNSRTEVD